MRVDIIKTSQLFSIILVSSLILFMSFGFDISRVWTVLLFMILLDLYLIAYFMKIKYRIILASAMFAAYIFMIYSYYK